MADTCILINFLHASRLDLLCEHSGYRIVVTEHVRAEIHDPLQAAIVKAAIDDGRIEEVTITDPGELLIFAELNAVLGRGESASIAVAEVRGWIVATDERRRALREIERRLSQGRLLTTPGVLLACIRAGALSVADADTIKAVLERHRFAMPFSSFAELFP